MNIRERVLSILNGKKPDVVPWLGDLAYWIEYLIKENKMPDKYKTNGKFDEIGLQQLHKDLGIGFYLQGYHPFITKYKNVEIKTSSVDNQNIVEYQTPYGKLRQITEYINGSYCWAIKEHLVKDYNDLDALKYLYENTYYEPNYELAQTRCNIIGDNGVVLCYLPKSPFMEMVALLAGIEAVTYMQIDAPKKFDSILKIMEEKHDEASQIALNSPAECLMIPENISSECVGKSNFEKYMRNYHEKWNKKIHLAGKYSFVHLDGTMKGLIKELSSTKFNVIEALTPAPVGDIPIEDLDKWVNEDTIMWGGLPGAFFSDSVSDKEFDDYIIRALNVMKKKPRYVLGVGDQVPPYASFERLKRIKELVEKYGKYED